MVFTNKLNVQSFANPFNLYFSVIVNTDARQQSVQPSLQLLGLLLHNQFYTFHLHLPADTLEQKFVYFLCAL